MNLNANLKTPYYHIDEQTLLKEYELLDSSLKNNWGNYIKGYSVKTNSLPWLLKSLLDNGFYAECVSEIEIDLSLSVGFPINKIIFNGPIKQREYVEKVLLNGGYVNIDSHDELRYLEDMSAKYPDTNFSVGIRVNFDIPKACPEEQLIEESGRFGFCYENGELAIAISRLNSLPNVKVEGLHMHSSSQSRTLNIYTALARMAGTIAREYNLTLKYVDMGGGYYGGVPDKPNYKDYFEAICKELSKHFDRNKTSIIVEPGVSLISSSMSLVTSVLDVKNIRDNKYIITDGSRVNLNPMVTRHTYPHHFEYIDDSRDLLPSQWITGFTCMEYDRLFECVNEKELKVGDKVIYDRAGGYTMCLSPLFIHYYPKVYVTKSDNSIHCVREEWGINEYLQKNRIE